MTAPTTTPATASTAAPAADNAQPPVWTLATSHPLALLPVRLETRFSGPNHERLLVRIFPDTVHVDSHEPELTPDEIASGADYWRAVWRAARHADREQAAWERLVAAVGATRATWVARVMEPDPDGRPQKPVPDDAPLPDKLPHFPVPKEKTAAWTRAAVARALPTRWVVTASCGTVVVRGVGGAIRPDLVVGPDPAADVSAVPDDLPPVGPSTAWLTDFEAARAAGMAVVLDLPAGPARGHLDRVLVYGVGEEAGPEAAAEELAALLEAQAATAGLSWLPPGTPTNNTDDLPSGFTTAVPPARVTHGDAAPADATSAGRATLALGLLTESGDDGPLTAVRGLPPREGAPTAAARAAHADDDEDAPARLVQEALWPAGLGYHLRHMMAGSVDEARLARIRDHYLRWVRAEGPLPAFRVGAQPYGILPVMESGRWRPLPGEPDDSAGLSLLSRLHSRVWKPSVRTLPRIGALPVPGAEALTPEQNLVRILGADARTREVRARSVLGGEYVVWLWRFLRLRLGADWRQSAFAEGTGLLRALGLPEDVPLATAVFANGSFRLGTPLVTGPDGTLGHLAALAAAGRTPAQLAAAADLGGGPTPLLYRLARAGLLAEVSRAAHALGAPEPVEPQLPDVEDGVVTNTLWRRLARPAPADPARTLGDYLADPPASDPATAALRSYRSALSALAGLPVETAERHTAGALGLAAHRLDAWTTSFAAKRLATLRAARPTGVHLGAYGWVTDLRAAPGRTPVANPPKAEDDPARPLVSAASGTGYVLAPSVGQAATAAVLRSAQRSHGGAGGGPLALDLSSRRVRTAQALLEGARSGLPLNAQLGYRFERGVHESPRGLLDRFLPAFRALAPAAATVVSPDGSTATGTLPSSVCDGLELFARHRDGRLPWGSAGLPAAGSADQLALAAVLDTLGDAVDALHDALLAEGVHQVVQGRPERAGAALDALSRGETTPPELEFPRTPRAASAVTHRLLLVGNVRTADRGAWGAAVGQQPRIVAAAHTDAVASALLPVPYRVFCRLRWVPPGGGTPVTGQISLDFLQIGAVDYVAMPPRGPAPCGAELEQRIALAAWQSARPAAADHDWTLELGFGRAAEWPVDRLSITEFLAAVAAVRRLFDHGRQLTAADLSEQNTEPADGLHPQDAINRAAFALGHVNDTLTALAAASASGGDPLRSALLKAAGAGVPGAVPPPRGAVGEAGLLAEAAASAERELRSRLSAHDRLRAAWAGEHPAGSPAPSAPEVSAHHQARIRALLGEDLPLLASFLPPAEPAGTGLAASLAVTAALQGTPGEGRRWLRQTGRVRGGAGRLQEVFDLAAALDAPVATGTDLVRVAQLPHVPGDRWWGARRPADAPEGGRLSLVLGVLPGAALDLSSAVYGLAVDEWVETVPDAVHTAAAALEFDAPAAVPPQTVLLAVPAVPEDSVWTPRGVELLLHQTLDRARTRLVDTDALGGAGQFLPGLHLGLNTDNRAVSTDFRPDAAP
ncbi:hypothetical protein OG416_35725 (plasmid) [Streptomyces longwoodensis]|uniref:hypothetical protein n=1 Tax=Streptomyces longwoodensis TaxID=68231 RepID=UPI002F910573|nr:hypothetical protein OG416_35725 [Streptomyces longwoodensis]